MIPHLGKVASKIDKFNDFIGHSVSWLTLFMVILMCINVIQRYLFQSNHIWAHELIQFMHAMVFLSAAGYVLRKDGHVRVDLLYECFSEEKRAKVNLFGTVFFLLPVCLALIYFSSIFVTSSWKIFEGSRENDGLPGVFLLKTFIWVFALTLILQSISIILNSLITLDKNK